MRNFRCAIIDLDGTLLDSTDVWQKVDEDFFAKRGIAVPSDYSKIISPLGFEKAAEYTIEAYSLKETKQQVMAEWDEMSKQKFATEVFLKKGAKEYLVKLKESGVKLCIATASYRELFVPALENNGVYELFDHDVTLKEVRRGKGFPDVYLKCAELSGEKVEDCVVFEDLYEGLRGAKDGGFYSVAVYDRNSEADTEKIKKISDKYIIDFTELL